MPTRAGPKYVDVMAVALVKLFDWFNWEFRLVRAKDGGSGASDEGKERLGWLESRKRSERH